MTDPTAFDRQEWLLLGTAPLAAAAAVAVAAPGGGRREEQALLLAWRSADAVFAESQLVGAIVRELDPQDRAEQEAAQAALAEPPSSFSNVLDEAIDLCQRALAVVEQRGSAQDVEDYRRFVLYLARQVATATREGSLLGLGGQAISRAERSALDQIARALGLDHDWADQTPGLV
ncbi:hypothetical protein [Kallotenue papyrolyticum]|uniref:hypothetical protein n=1 Tax=Kallotenue papyrolyticum TaxID=1325125 RepID=UPI0004785486|nr:hypothetical protein [Kallotenue papyrolyticum]